MTTITLSLTPTQASILRHALSQELVNLKADVTVNKLEGAEQRHLEAVALFREVATQLKGSGL